MANLSKRLLHPHPFAQFLQTWSLGQTWQANVVVSLFASVLLGGAVIIEPEEYPVEFFLFALVLCAGLVSLGFARGKSQQ